MDSDLSSFTIKENNIAHQKIEMLATLENEQNKQKNDEILSKN
jgi:hypothetical protein